MMSVFSRFWIAFLLLTSLGFARSSTPLDLAASASKHISTKVSTKASGPLVVLDPGHGGDDNGATVRQLQEKKITLLTALYAKKELEDLGYRVLLTRKKDAYISLPKRVSIANQTQSMLFLSIHCNAASNTLAQGLEIYYYKGGSSSRGASSFTLADSTLHSITKQTGCSSRGVKSGRFYVIRETTMPSILIEIGFLTNYDEWANMRRKSYLEKVARGIAQGVHNYFKLQ